MDALAAAAELDPLYSPSAAAKPAKPAKGARIYTCSICQKSFKRSEHCSRHERGHTREKPFPCRHCGRRYGRKDIVLRHEKSFHALDRPQRNNPPPRANNTTDAIAAPPSMHPTPQSTQPMMKQEPEPRRPDFDPQILQQPAHEVIPAFQNQFTQHAAQQQPQAPPPQQIHPAFYPQYRQAPPNPDFHHAFNHHMQQGPPQHMQAPNNMTFPNQQQLDPRLWGSPTPEASNSTLDPALREYDQQHRTGSGSSPSSYVKTEENGEQLS